MINRINMFLKYFLANKRVATIFFGFAVYVNVNPVMAEKYIVDKGGDLEICKKYKESIETAVLGRVAKCERKFSEKLTDLRNPVWKELDIWKNRDLFRKSYKYIRSGNINKPHSGIDSDSDLKSVLKIWEKNKSISFRITSEDIDNDGKPDNLINLSFGSCEKSIKSPYYSVLLVLKDMKTIDEIKTFNLDQNILYDKQIDQWVEAKFNINYMQYGVLKLGDKVYFDKSDLKNNDGFTLYFYEKNKVNDICHIK